MATLRLVSGRQAARALEQVGYRLDRQRGSHLILRHVEPPHRRLTVPDHRELAMGTLRAIIRQAGLTVDAFVSRLD
jgi:predicted RNA binding protein YcfA (HicA-like mRNA interferase family)